MKTLTENVELIQMLNRLRHGVSYCQLEKKLHSFVPSEDGSKLKSEGGSFRDYSTYLMCSPAWHGITSDRRHSQEREPLTVLMELLSDSRYTDHNPSIRPPVISKRKQRTITQEVQPLAASIRGDRVRPQPLRTAIIDYGGQEQISRRKDLL